MLKLSLLLALSKLSIALIIIGVVILVVALILKKRG